MNFKRDARDSAKAKAEFGSQPKRNVAVPGLLDGPLGGPARVFLISIDDIFATLGQRNELLEAGANLICGRAIRDRVGETGVFGPVDKGAYLFGFDEPSEERAWAKAVAIVDEIGAKIFGVAYRPDATLPVIGLAVTTAAHIRAGQGKVDEGRVAEVLRTVKKKPRRRVFLEWHKAARDRAEHPATAREAIRPGELVAEAQGMPEASGEARAAGVGRSRRATAQRP